MREKLHVYYLRGSNNEPYGVIVAKRNGAIGTSVCHTPLDRFNKHRGVEIALGRANKAVGLAPNGPLILQGKQTAKMFALRTHVARIRRLIMGLESDSFFSYEVKAYETENA